MQKCFSLYWKSKRSSSRFFKRNSESILFYFVLIWYEYKMAEYSTLNVKLLNSQLDDLKSGIKNGTEVTLNLSSNVVGGFNDETNFPHKFFFFFYL